MYLSREDRSTGNTQFLKYVNILISEEEVSSDLHAGMHAGMHAEENEQNNNNEREDNSVAHKDKHNADILITNDLRIKIC